jgi:hypothetical protein
LLHAKLIIGQPIPVSVCFIPGTNIYGFLTFFCISSEEISQRTDPQNYKGDIIGVTADYISENTLKTLLENLHFFIFTETVFGGLFITNRDTTSL